jgi:hypothetical protein
LLPTRFFGVCRGEALTQLDVSFHAQENVVGLDIAVYDALGMQMLQTLKSFPANGRYLAFGHDVERHDVSETATLHKLHYHP